MRSSTPSDSVHVRAPGKINLALGVGRRQDDGYHPLATVFQAVSAFEDVVASPAADVSVTVTGLHADRVPTDETNLAVRAALLLARTTGVEDGVALHITKGVPVAGGMGGGSADAAAALVACDALWRTGLSRAELAELGAELGADVPFALVGQTAVGRGRGDVLSPAMTRGEYHWALGVQDRGLSTASVYGVFDDLLGSAAPDEPEIGHELMRALRACDLIALGSELTNDLQAAALEVAPGLAETLAVAEDAGALGVVVSGSGPTVAALARGRQHAMGIAAAMTAAGVADDVLCVSGPVTGARAVTSGEVGSGLPVRGDRG